MPIIRLLLVASLLLSQVGCRSLSPQAPQVTHGVFPVPVVSSSDLPVSITTESEALYQLTKLPTDEVPVGVSYIPGSRPAGTVLGFERTPEGLFAICGTNRIPLESTAHRWERLEERIVPDPPQRTFEEVTRDWTARIAEGSANLAWYAVVLAATGALMFGYALAAGKSRQAGGWGR